VDGVFHGAETGLVGLAIDYAGFEAAAGEPHGEGVDVIGPAGGLPRARPEFL
jgi:hypothetical protein